VSSLRPHVAVLVPQLGASPAPPEDLPLGRAALLAAARGIPTLFATHTERGRAHGVIARPGRWEPVQDVPVLVVYDRFPCQSQPARHQALLDELPGIPVANPPSLVRLCRDKLETQRVLERSAVRMPEVEGDPSHFPQRLREWGTAFLKPRFGSFGQGVHRLSAGQHLPEIGEELILQRAIAPPAGLAGLCCRVLVQREGGSFCAPEPVVRQSPTDPVVNAARGAEVLRLWEALPELAPQVVALGVQAAEALAQEPGGEWLVEVGVDVVLSPEGQPWVIEVNGRPRGRLEVLAARDPTRWLTLHTETCLRPLQWLWQRR
jgi:glutathione synthase/RimK-type ligase-like ATP-grasp enzyme